MKKTQIGMIGISNVRIYTVSNYQVKGENRFGEGSITSEQIKTVYADIADKIDEIERVHPRVCMEVRTGRNVTRDINGEEPIVWLRAYRYPEGGSEIPEYITEIEEGSIFGFYECNKDGHSLGYECGPWMGRTGDIWDIMIETGEEATKRKASLERVCGFS